MAQVTDRPDRTKETRTEEVRKYRYVPPSNLPEPDPEPGYVFRYVALTVLGETNMQNVNIRRQEGWIPVAPKTQPRLMRHFSIPENAPTIEFGGLQLCKIPEEQWNAKVEYYEAMSVAQASEAKSKFRQEAMPIDKMPLHDDSRQETSRGRRESFGSGQ